MRCSGQPVKVRLAQIDAPEVAHPRYGKPGQPYGEQARTDLVGLIGGHTLRLTWTHRGRYHRIIGELHLGSIDVNAWLVARGDAWAYPRYVHDYRLFKLQRDAKAKQLGLWARPNPIPPWQWRHGRYNQPAQPSSLREVHLR